MADRNSSSKSATAAARLDSLSNQIQSTSESAKMSSELEQVLAQGVKDGKIPHAIVFATNRDGSFKYSHATGFQNYGVNDEPIQEDALLMLASQTKLLTAIAALKAVEQGLIGLDDDVAPHLPELARAKVIVSFDDEKNEPVLKDRKNPITLRHLLLHISGCAYSFTPELMKFDAARGRAAAFDEQHFPTIVERFDHPLIFEPGTSWSYGPGLDWAGLLVQRVSGLELEEYQIKYLWKPLGITGITYWPEKHPEIKDKIPQLVVRRSDGTFKPNDRATFNTGSTDCMGGQGAYAQLGDYLEVMRSLLANDGRLLSSHSVDELFRPQTTGAPDETLNSYLKEMGWTLSGGFAEDVEVSWALGGLVFLKDDVGRRRKGTLSWGGLVHPYWTIDREAGLALTVGFQVIPPGDADVGEMTGIAERAVYKMAGLA